MSSYMQHGNFKTVSAQSTRKQQSYEARKDKHLQSTDRFRCPARWRPADRCKCWRSRSSHYCPSWATWAPTATAGCSWASCTTPPPDRPPSSGWSPSGVFRDRPDASVSASGAAEIRSLLSVHSELLTETVDNRGWWWLEGEVGAGAADSRK